MFTYHAETIDRYTFRKAAIHASSIKSQSLLPPKQLALRTSQRFLSFVQQQDRSNSGQQI